jgi:hypothetical protein
MTKKDRDLSKYIHDNANDVIIVTLKEFVGRLFKLVSQYSLYIISVADKDFIAKQTTTETAAYNKIILDCLMPVESQKAGNCGQVIRSYDNLLYILKNGNTRELLTIVYNFRNSCHVIWDIVRLYSIDLQKYNYYFGKLLKKRRIDKLIDSITNKLGAPINVILQACYTSSSLCFKATDPKSLCGYAFYPTADQIMTVRCIKQGSEHRIARSVVAPGNKIRVKDVVPPLSSLEKDFIAKFNNVNLKMNDPVPWISGIDYYRINHDSIFGVLYKHLNKNLFTGPSGSADFVLNLASFFNFNKKQTIHILLGLVVWMCLPGDHNLFEIVSVASKFKHIDFKNLNNDEYEYIKNLVINHNYTLKSYSISPPRS